MKILDLICSTGRTGYFNKDLAAIRGGVTSDGFSYHGAPQTPGFRHVVQPGESVSVMLLLEDGQVALGDCIDVIFTGAAGRDPLFRALDHLPVLQTAVRDCLRGRTCDVFAPLAAEVDALAPDGKPLHTAVRYGVTQALLHAAALAHRQTMAEVVAREYGCTIADAPIPILGMCPTDQVKQVDKMILKRLEYLPHGSFANVEQDVGADGSKLRAYAAWVAGRVKTLGNTDYKPGVHLDVYGTLGELFDDDLDRVADFLVALQGDVAPLALLVETPMIAVDRAAQIEMFRHLRQALATRRADIKLIADEWCNTLDDIKAFADAEAVDYIQVKTPDLGGLNNTIEALLYCRNKGMGLYLGGSANETDQSARVCAHIALACRADILMCKPGQGVDEGVLILTNEMRRALALIQASSAASR
ncbi:MAG: methylaspartate ammonia-lyase [Alphaproteobacteria bacterium]|nr:methylaspartate ammonia-lyase [Alphaproteobacteria bacterium]